MELTALILCLSPQQADPNGDRFRPEEIEEVRTKTAFPLRREEVQTDFVLTSLEFEDEAQEHTDATFAVEVAYGVTDWLTAELQIPFLHRDFAPGDDESGVGDLELELKGTLNRDLIPFLDASALGVRISVPTGDEDRGLGHDEPVFNFFFAASQVYDWFSIHGQAFVALEQDEGTRYGLNFALGAAPWNPRLMLLLGMNVRMEAGEPIEWTLVPGFNYLWAEERIQAGIGVPIGLTADGDDDETEDWGLITDFQVKF